MTLKMPFFRDLYKGLQIGHRGPDDIEPLCPDLEEYQIYELIGSIIAGRQPFLASRLGYTESQCLTQRGGRSNPSRATLERIHNFSGVFPPERSEFRRFGDEYLGALAEVDLLGLIGTGPERQLVEAHSPKVRKCPLGALEPYLCSTPWSRHLSGLRVCVVHPFADSIAAQYASVRRELFPGTDVLPEFELDVIKPPQTIAGNTSGFASWSAALESLTADVLSRDFEVAILGCGAYGLPLGARLKRAGKIVIHMGGATQILFGVTGARWRENPVFQRLFNSAWKPPLESERPPGWETIENGCYW